MKRSGRRTSSPPWAERKAATERLAGSGGACGGAVFASSAPSSTATGRSLRAPKCLAITTALSTDRAATRALPTDSGCIQTTSASGLNWQATGTASNTRHFQMRLVACAAEVRRVSQASRLRVLEAEGLLHPRPDAVSAALFAEGGFFLAADKVQVKYEMLRAHLLDGVAVTAAAAAHGYSRAGFYLIAAAFEQAGMSGLLDDKRGRHGPVKLTAEIVEFLQLRHRPVPARN